MADAVQDYTACEMPASPAAGALARFGLPRPVPRIVVVAFIVTLSIARWRRPALVVLALLAWPLFEQPGGRAWAALLGLVAAGGIAWLMLDALSNPRPGSAAGSIGTRLSGIDNLVENMWEHTGTTFSSIEVLGRHPLGLASLEPLLLGGVPPAVHVTVRMLAPAAALRQQQRPPKAWIAGYLPDRRRFENASVVATFVAVTLWTLWRPVAAP